MLLSDEELLESELPPGPSDIPGAIVVTRSASFLLMEALGPSNFTLELLLEVFPGASKLTLDLLEELLLVEPLLEDPLPGPVRLTPELELPELVELLEFELLELLELELPDTPGPVKLALDELLPVEPLTPGPPEEPEEELPLVPVAVVLPLKNVPCTMDFNPYAVWAEES